MRLTAEYLEQARHFECIARQEDDLQQRRDLEKRADVYRKLSEARARKLGITATTARADDSFEIAVRRRSMAG
jgi:hypothetical protein